MFCIRSRLLVFFFFRSVFLEIDFMVVVVRGFVFCEGGRIRVEFNLLKIF